MRITFLTHYFPPEVGAPQTRLSETIRELRAAGATVRVVTNHPHYPDGHVRQGYRAATIKRESTRGVKVLRMPVLAQPNRGFLSRIADQASFALTASATWAEVRKADVLYVETPPLFLSLTAAWLKFAAARPYLLHVADPWPDYPIELGVLTNPLAIAAARSVERIGYSGARIITTPTRGCAQMIEQQSEAAGKVVVVPNAVDVSRFAESIRKSTARKNLRWSDAPTFVYVGTVGLAQGLDTLLTAAALVGAKELPEASRPVIRVIGDGPDRDRLRVEARDRRLPVVFHEPVPASAVPEILSAADACLVVLRRGRLAEAAQPTKLVEAMAAGRPVLVSGDGEASDLVKQARAGLTSPAEDPALLASNVMELAVDSRLRRTMGERGREVAIRQFDRRAVAQRLLGLLERASNSGPPRG